MPITRVNPDAEAMRLLADPCASYWLKDTLRAALKRDCVDAANEARYLAELLGRRADAILAAD